MSSHKEKIRSQTCKTSLSSLCNWFMQLLTSIIKAQAKYFTENGISVAYAGKHESTAGLLFLWHYTPLNMPLN